ncbi:MAG: hypothetical protein ACI31G_03095 [Bacilli bacterium]
MITYQIKNEFIDINTNKLSITLCSVGASIYRLKVFNHDFFLSCDDKKEFLYSKGFYGKTLGPIAGRYNLKDYDNSIHEDKVILHGQEHALSFQKFNYKVLLKENEIKIIFKIKYDNKSIDFIGNHALYKVIYIIKDNKEEILIKHQIKALKDTYASLSLHSYFVLSENNKSLDYKLKLDCLNRSIVKDNYLIDRFTPIDEGFNFSTLRKINHEVNKNPKLKEKGHYFINNKKDVIIKDNNYKVIIKSDYKDVLLTLNQLPVGTIFHNQKEEKFSAIVIENEIAPNQKDLLFLKENETRKQYIKYVFKKI